MSRRSISEHCRCAHEGCREVALFEHATVKAYRESALKHRVSPWLCLRHMRPEENLSAESPERKTVLVVGHLESLPDRRYWLDPSEKHHARAVEYGAGYRACAEDFPEGTRLEITARVVLPEEKL